MKSFHKRKNEKMQTKKMLNINTNKYNCYLELKGMISVEREIFSLLNLLLRMLKHRNDTKNKN